MSIQDYVIENLKNDSKNDILDMINESINDNDDATLPGLGVLLKLMWSKLSDDEKKYSSEKIYDGIKDNIK